MKEPAVSEDSTNQTREHEQTEIDMTPKGVVDLQSVLYVVGGIPCMILVFVVLFSLVGACDTVNTYIPA